MVVEIPGVFDAVECERVLGCIDQFGQTSGGVGRADGRGAEIDRGVRSARHTTLPSTGTTEWVYDRLAAAIDGCNAERFCFDLRDFSEPLAIVDYRTGDFYDWHLDLGRGASTRKLSASVMLSAPEDYVGGALTFPGARFDRVARGSAIVFASFLLHGVQPLTGGRRCALVAWVGGPPFR